jgi:hypothetical protein
MNPLMTGSACVAMSRVWKGMRLENWRPFNDFYMGTSRRHFVEAETVLATKANILNQAT